MADNIDRSLPLAAEEKKATSSRAYSSYVLVILSLVSFFNYADRMVLSVLLQPIKLEFGFTDTQLGLLSGLAFTLFYATLGLPLARLADRRSRITIIACAMVVWSTMTALCGAAQNFTHLLLARIGVGAGEAGCIPPSHSLLGDYFSKERRAFAIGVHTAGGYLGIMIGLLVAGYIAEHYGWRWTFVWLGLPGVVVALIAWLTVREPVRGCMETGFTSPGKSVKWQDAFAILFKRKTFRQIVMAYSLALFATYGMMQWIPTFFVRSHGMSLAEIGRIYGLATGIGGLIGVLAGGLLAPKLIRRDPRWELWLPALCYASAAPLYLLVFIMPPDIALSTVFIANMIVALAIGPGLSSIQSVAEPHLRATAVAIVMFFSALLGQGGGPFLIGLISDRLLPYYGEHALRVALSVSTLLVFWSAFHFLFASRTLERDRVN